MQFSISNGEGYSKYEILYKGAAQMFLQPADQMLFKNQFSTNVAKVQSSTSPYCDEATGLVI